MHEVRFHHGPVPATPLPSADGAGAVVTFDGVIRPTEDGRAILAIDYEVYRPMADDVLAAICAETMERFGLRLIEAHHSVGRVPVGACSFRLVVAAEHRAPALEAAAWFISRMKQDAPIWKKPVFSGERA